MRFPHGAGTTIFFDQGAGDDLPIVRRIGSTNGSTGAAIDACAIDAFRPGCPLLVEHSAPTFLAPGIAGHRVGGDGAPIGADWTTRFQTTSVQVDERLTITAVDQGAGLDLLTEAESLPGGALRIRHTLTNIGQSPYLVSELAVSVPVPPQATEILDFTGRHERERQPQRHTLADGRWVRESRTGRPGLDAPTMIVIGQPGFGFNHGEVLAVAVASSGNSSMSVSRSADEAARLSGGELLLPGDVVLAAGESYATPWVFFIAATNGLDEVAAALHTWQRTLPTHPGLQPVTLNTWEAVYMDHDRERLTELAQRAARVGVERFVLDDGWFHLRRSDNAGLGDWWVDPAVWPDGLAPFAEQVRGLGMQFGLWFEPEMVNLDSDLVRAHPEWVMQPAGRLTRPQRQQYVLDLTQPEAFAHVRDAISAVLTQVQVDYVKWDHNRELLEAGSTARAGAAVAQQQNIAYLALLDDLRARHPHIEWESCASGGGRIDLSTIEHVERFWTSDMTDALSRQHIQRWTTQLVAPEYLGAHVSSPTSHQTGRTLGLDFRCGTALFGSFGIEWDITQANDADLDRLAAWVDLYQEHRALLQTGRVFRCDLADPTVYAYGVVSRSGDEAILAVAQLDEAGPNTGVSARVPGLAADGDFGLAWLGPVDLRATSHAAAPAQGGPIGAGRATGAQLASAGVWLPRRRPETITLVHITR